MNINKLILFAFILSFSIVGNVFAVESELLRLRRTSTNNSVQLYFIFDDLPKYKKIVKGKRIDLLLDTVLKNTEPIEFQTDDKVVKFLTQTRDTTTLISFFMRYDPQQVEVSTPQPDTLVVDILLGNQFTKTYPELTSKLEGLTVVNEKTTDFGNPLVSNPYAGNWKLFFSKYEPEIHTEASVAFTLPPFPVISLISDNSNIDIIPEEIFPLLTERLWEDMIPIIFSAINQYEALEVKKLLALTYGEILLRSGRYADSYKQLYLLKSNYPDETIGTAASYLLALLRAEFEDPYVADYELRNLEDFIDTRFPLSPFMLLSQVETSLATHQYKRTIQLLERDDIAYPPGLEEKKRLRLADYWFSTRNYVKSYVGYTLLLPIGIIYDQPYSLNGYCETLYQQKKFARASECYQSLTTIVKEKSQLSTIALKKAMAELRFKSSRDMYVSFSTIEDTYPGTVAAFRAAIKKTDIRYLSQPSWRKTSVKYYKALAEKATDRRIAEEAAIKEAIAYSELGEHFTSINLLMDFLRDYRKSDLTTTAQALLIEILPGELKRLLESEEYVPALVLAKKNRQLFQNNWVDLNLLAMLARAYLELSIFDEAKKLYLYLLKASGKEAKEDYYLPLISIFFNQKEYNLIEDYGAEYNYNFPDGSDKKDIFLYRLKALILTERIDRAKKLLLELSFGSPPISKEAAGMFFRENNYAKTKEYLYSMWTGNEELTADLQFYLAESLYQLGNVDEAYTLFSTLKSNQKFYEQARYRLASIEQNRGNQDKALKLFEEIVEKGKDPLWIKLAARELEFFSLKNKY